MLGHVGWFDRFLFWIGNSGDTFILSGTAVILAGLWWYEKGWHAKGMYQWLFEIGEVIFSVMSAWGITYLLKTWFHSPRPFVTFPEIHPMIHESPYTSFPSGHATLYFALATGIFILHPRLGKYYFVLATGVALSRVILGVHYPRDIVAGALIGVGASLLIWKLCVGLRKKLLSKTT
jgi:undecaprenyl-diphosphatase